MKSNGIVRKIDELGRIVLPVNLRRELNIGPNDMVEVYSDEEKIIVKKHIKSCVFCGSEENIIDVNSRSVCKMCTGEICKLFSENN